MVQQDGPASRPGAGDKGAAGTGDAESAPPADAQPPTMSLTTPDGEQGVLFGESQASTADIGYRGPTACAAAGITYRQLDYWARTGLVEPTIREAAGSGTQRLYSFRDILVLKVVKRLLDTGVSLQNIRAAVATLRQRGVEDLSRITLLSDGATVYELKSADEVVDLLQGGQAVFAIALGRVVRDVEGSLANLPGERPDAVETAADTEGEPHSADELAHRRRNRNTG